MLWSTDGKFWNTSSGGFSTGGYGVAWNGSLWVAAGDGGSSASNMMWSTDGKTWNPPTGNTFYSLGRSVAWNGSLWVAAGNAVSAAGSMMWSTDGKTWNASANNTFSGAGNAVAWNGSLWVAAGSGGGAAGSMMWSTDGKTWNASTNSSFSSSGNAVASAIPLTAYVSPASIAGSVTTGSLLTVTGSTGGFGSYGNSDLTFTGGNLRVGVPSGSAVTATGSVNVSGGYYVNGVLQTNGSTIAGSTTAGSLLTASGPTGYFGNSDLTFTGGILSVGGATGFGGLNTGPTGIVNVTNGYYVNGAPLPLTVGSNLFVAGGYNLTATVGVLSTSPDGVNWTSRTITGLATGVNCVAWNGTLWAAGGTTTGSAGALSTSPDGVNWTSQTITGITGSVQCIAWNGSLWVAGGYTAGIGAGALSTSPDGVNWTSRTITGFVSAVAWNGSIWVVVGNTSTPVGTLSTSSDGITWTSRTIPGTIAYLYDVKWNGSLWIIVGQSTSVTGILYTSPDGITWTSRTITGMTVAQSVVNCIAWNGSLWVAGGQNSATAGALSTSPDGITWTSRTIAGVTSTVRGVAWNGSLWVVVGQSVSAGALCTSPDGITWTTRIPTGLAGAIYGLASRTVLPYVATGLPNIQNAGPTGGWLLTTAQSSVPLGTTAGYASIGMAANSNLALSTIGVLSVGIPTGSAVTATGSVNVQGGYYVNGVLQTSGGGSTIAGTTTAGSLLTASGPTGYFGNSNLTFTGGILNVGAPTVGSTTTNSINVQGGYYVNGVLQTSGGGSTISGSTTTGNLLTTNGTTSGLVGNSTLTFVSSVFTTPSNTYLANTAGSVAIGSAATLPTFSGLSVNGGVVLSNGYRPLYSNVSSGTSISPSASAYGTHFNITTSAITAMTISAQAAVDSNAYWVFRNNTGTYLSITITYSGISGSGPTTMPIPPSTSVTLWYTGATSGTSAYVFF